MMLCQFACSLARACWWQLCKSDMSLASTAHHVAVTNKRHKLTLDTHTHTVTRFLHCILFSSLLTTVRDIFMLLWQFCVSRLLYIWQRTERYVIHWGPFYIYVLTAILPGETGLASLLELRMMEVVTTGAIRRAKLQSNRPPTNRHPVFTGRMPCLSPNQQCQSTEGKSMSTSVLWN